MFVIIIILLFFINFLFQLRVYFSSYFSVYHNFEYALSLIQSCDYPLTPYPLTPYPLTLYPLTPYPLTPYPLAPYPLTPYPLAPYPLSHQASSVLVAEIVGVKCYIIIKLKQVC